MKTGISLYLSSGAQATREVLARAAASGVSLVFTSLHIPEDAGGISLSDAKDLIEQVRSAKMELMVDVGPETCSLLGCQSVEDLAALGITSIRLDYGFTHNEVAELSHTFRIVCNASTVSREDIRAWKAAGADLSRFTACHNYYPKPLTGLSMSDLRQINERLNAWGLEVLAFVPGDGERRGPLHEGLPTIEVHRAHPEMLAEQALDLVYQGGCDGVIVGDIGLSTNSWNRMAQISQGFVDLRCEFESGFEYLDGQIHHDRPDSSSYVFRSQESRSTLRTVASSAYVDASDSEPFVCAQCADSDMQPADLGAQAACVQPVVAGSQPVGVSTQSVDSSVQRTCARPQGTISIANADYLRYEGEFEIARQDLAGDPRQMLAGRVCAQDLHLLKLVRSGFGIRFKRVE
ncbi:MupG family TIM beta-alpha barrel fold protein [Collinsella sp. AGMB00827]|uniref:MupG family TIM beta-alpha barrel fold protein n=1 Tax=Collinsella ureilytica TaxID=2869515 RepID=A0ABS7MJQ1_9ACTN|nr:MupG family TIM beta-alpha barrel fold protein [Collinsella urealyticum]MBY4797548.1 MupG family TIM beta-alpha barrel fold protein [Collinsella urealyticum]